MRTWSTPRCLSTGTARRSVPVHAGELKDRGLLACENRVQRLCSNQRIFSVFAKKRDLTGERSGPPPSSGLVQCLSIANRP